MQTALRGTILIGAVLIAGITFVLPTPRNSSETADCKPSASVKEEGIGAVLLPDKGSSFDTRSSDHPVLDDSSDRQASISPEEELRPSVSGVVLSRDGPVASATVYAYVVNVNHHDQPIYQTITNETGAFELCLPPLSTCQYSVDVGCVAEGYLRTLVQDLSVHAKETATLDLFLDPGLSITGFIYDETGKPLEDIEVLATQHFRMERTTGFISSAMLDTSALRLARRDSTYHESGCESSEGGLFEVSGLAPGEYLLVSRSDAYLWVPKRVFAGDRNVSLHATSPAGVILQVLDAESGSPILRPTVCLRIDGLKLDGTPTHPIRMGVGVRGHAKVVWKPDASYQINSLDVQVDADGYESYRGNFPVLSGGPIKATIELARLSFSAARILARFEDGELPTEDLVVHYQSDDGSFDGTVLAWSLTPGEYMCHLPKGQWSLSIRMASDIGAIPPWTSPALDCTADQVIYNVVLAKGLAINVVFPHPCTWSATLEKQDFEGQRTFKDMIGRITGIPAAKWSLRVYSPDVNLDWQTSVISLGHGEINIQVP